MKPAAFAMPMLMVLLFWVLSMFGFAQGATPSPALPDVLWQILMTVAMSDAVWALAIAWLLSLVPGPFRSIAEGLAGWLREWIQGELAKRQKSAAQTAVLAAAQIVKPQSAAGNEFAKTIALEAAERLGVPHDVANARVEAAFKELKSQGVVR